MVDAVVGCEVVVVGGGQAGLAVGYHLRRAGIGFQLVDAGARIGHVWRSRWDSLRLFTPARYAGLPGMPFPADPFSYPGRDDVADYLEAYADRFGLPVRLGVRASGLARDGDRFVLTLDTGEHVRARTVVLATGPFSVPYVPVSAAGLSSDVAQLHTAFYRAPDQIPPGRVVVVGGGNSGFQIAAELAAAGRTVELSEGRRNRAVPQRPLGRDLFWWLDNLGIVRLTADSRLGARLEANQVTIIGSSRRGLRRLGVTLRPRATALSGRTVRFADGSATDADTVVWATGYRTDDTWVDIDAALDDHGELIQRRGVTSVPGLYTIGRPWQHTTGSALLGFVQYDAAWLVEQLAGHS